MKNYLAVMLSVLSSLFVFLGVSRAGECVFLGHGKGSDFYYDSSSVNYSGDIVMYDVYDYATCEVDELFPVTYEIDCAREMARYWNEVNEEWSPWESFAPRSAQGAARIKFCRPAVPQAVQSPLDGYPRYPVTVNYDLSVEEAVKAGKYDLLHSKITTEKFPSNRHGTAGVEIILINFNRPMMADEVLRELDKLGLRPAELLELLAFGAKYPDVQLGDICHPSRNFQILALGSVWQDSDPHGYRWVPSLYGDSSKNGRCPLFKAACKRGIGLFLRDLYDFKWDPSNRFAAVRK